MHACKQHLVMFYPYLSTSPITGWVKAARVAYSSVANKQRRSNQQGTHCFKQHNQTTPRPGVILTQSLLLLTC